MKACATGDWHAGVSALDLEEQEKVWHRIVDVALENGVALFLHGGDLYNGPVVTMEQIAAVRRVFNRVREAHIPIVLVRGNSTHDLAVRPVDALDIFRDYEGIHVAARPENIVAGGCVVSCLPWVSPARLIAEQNGSVDRGKLNESAAQQLVKIAERLHEQRPALVGQGLPNILLLHHSISCASLPNGLPVADLREPVLEWADLDAIGFDAICAFHIHRFQQLHDPMLGDATLGFYGGSPQPLNHGESGYEHGVVLLDVEPGAVSFEVLPIEAPRFVTLKLTDHEIDEGIDGPFVGESWQGAGAIVRVRYTATREQDATIDKDAIRRELLAAGASRVTIEPQITREVRARSEAMTQDLSDLDALALYCEAQGIEAGMAERMGSRLRTWSSS